MKVYQMILFVFASEISFGQDIGHISKILDSAYLKSTFSANILISNKGKTVFEKSYGYADAIKKKTLTRKNSFQVASISKQFTAYGIMQLKSKGLLDYDSSVRKYIPSFPYDNITIRHLLTHTSGLPEFWDDIRPRLDTTKSNGNKEVLEYLIAHKLPLQSSPGAKFIYCDIGYDFLATIIEDISGMSYRDYLSKYIFKPLKMKSTHAYMVTDISRIRNKDLAPGHLYEDQKFSYAHLHPKYGFVFYLGDFYGDGSVVTSAEDLAKWSRALDNCELLTCEVQAEAFSPAMFNGQKVQVRSDADIGYGFGWFIKNVPAGKVVYHTGAHPGNVHMIYRMPEQDLTFIFLSNAETPDFRAIRSRLTNYLDSQIVK
jgi:CubicO group peptidase (beta-lactamase class C family)